MDNAEVILINNIYRNMILSRLVTLQCTKQGYIIRCMHIIFISTCNYSCDGLFHLTCIQSLLIKFYHNLKKLYIHVKPKVTINTVSVSANDMKPIWYNSDTMLIHLECELHVQRGRSVEASMYYSKCCYTNCQGSIVRQCPAS